MNSFLENVENGFVLILQLKKGGWSYTRDFTVIFEHQKGVSYAGFYGTPNTSKMSKLACSLEKQNLCFLQVFAVVA